MADKNKENKHVLDDKKDTERGSQLQSNDLDEAKGNKQDEKKEKDDK
ncbi:hypothetical protein [Lentibacillus sediminis]|nr:hypothetical protein [Lentibacillus sediminis]